MRETVSVGERETASPSNWRKKETLYASTQHVLTTASLLRSFCNRIAATCSLLALPLVLALLKLAVTWLYLVCIWLDTSLLIVILTSSSSSISVTVSTASVLVLVVVVDSLCLLAFLFSCFALTLRRRSRIMTAFTIAMTARFCVYSVFVVAAAAAAIAAVALAAAVISEWIFKASRSWFVVDAADCECTTSAIQTLFNCVDPLLLFLRFKNSLSTVPSCQRTRGSD